MKTKHRQSADYRHRQLIEATIDSLARRGYANTTMTHVVSGAALSRGIVNFHFANKLKLFDATFRFMAAEYAYHWHS